MICEPCQHGSHKRCTEGECECPRRIEKAAEEVIGRSSGTVEADAIFGLLMSHGSDLTKMFSENAGPERTKAFIREILQGRRALVN